MELKDVLLRRRSVRKFTEEPVTEQMIDELMHAAMSGPSACNRVPWEFYVVTDPDKLAELRGASRFTKIHAPLAVVVCGNLSRALPGDMAEYWVQDCSAATENLLLRAVDLGLGSVWCGLYPQPGAVERVKAMLDMPGEIIPLGLIHVGHPDAPVVPRDQYNPAFVHRV